MVVSRTLPAKDKKLKVNSTIWAQVSETVLQVPLGVLLLVSLVTVKPRLKLNINTTLESLSNAVQNMTSSEAPKFKSCFSDP